MLRYITAKPFCKMLFVVFSNKAVSYKADSFLKTVCSYYDGVLVLHDCANCFQRFQFSCLSALVLGAVVGKILQTKGKCSTCSCLGCADGWSNRAVKTRGRS